MFECSLYAIVQHTELDHLLARLRSLCPHPAVHPAHDALRSDFYADYTRLYWPLSPSLYRTDDVVLHLRASMPPPCSSSHPDPNNSSHPSSSDLNIIEHDDDPVHPSLLDWTLYQFGSPEVQGKYPCTVRSISSSRVLSGDIDALMTQIGYSCAFEFTRRGFAFLFAHPLSPVRVLIYRLHRPTDTHFPVSQNDFWIVEVVSMPIHQKDIEVMKGVMERVKEEMTGVAKLVDVDHRLLMQRVP